MTSRKDDTPWARTVQFRIDPDKKRCLETIARDQGRTMSSLLRFMVMKLIEQHRGGPAGR